MACRFKLGDQVMAAPWLPDSRFYGDVHPGDVGTVISEDGGTPGINWGRNVGGHDCGHYDIPNGYATWELEDNLILATESEEQIDIVSPNLEEII